MTDKPFVAINNNELSRTVCIEISGYEDRAKMFTILATNGYKCWQSEKKDFVTGRTEKYFVCFLLKQKKRRRHDRPRYFKPRRDSGRY